MYVCNVCYYQYLQTLLVPVKSQWKQLVFRTDLGLLMVSETSLYDSMSLLFPNVLMWHISPQIWSFQIVAWFRTPKTWWNWIKMSKQNKLNINKFLVQIITQSWHRHLIWHHTPCRLLVKGLVTKIIITDSFPFFTHMIGNKHKQYQVSLKNFHLNKFVPNLFYLCEKIWNPCSQSNKNLITFF